MSDYVYRGEALLRNWLAPSVQERFDNHTRPARGSDCILWCGCILQSGYGQISMKKFKMRAHVYSYIRANGPVPKGAVIRHTCDIRNCVNHRHLVAGTQKDNKRDSIERGRHARHSSHGRAKLTPSQVEEIRNSVGRQVDIGKRFGVGQSQVGRIKRGEHWVARNGR